MIYCIQVASKTEEEIIQVIQDYVKDIISDIFYPTRIKRKKLGGKWIDTKERLFPGYVFVETSKPSELHSKLYDIDAFTKLIGIKDKKTNTMSFIPLDEDEEDLINRLCGKATNHVTTVSTVMLLKDKTIEVIDGPLYGMEGKVVRIDPHKKNVTVRVSLMGRETDVVVSAEIVREENRFENHSVA